MGFVASIFGGGSARHAANVANVRAQFQAQQQQQAGQSMYNAILQNGQNQFNNITNAGQAAYQQLTNVIPGITAPFQPMIQAGQAAAQQYQADLPQLTAQFAPTMAQLAATPGYQFTLQQGLESTQNAAAARGLGVSGAALKAASNYATGLAQQTYAQDAGIYQAGQQIAGSNLLNGMNAGTNAANAAGTLSSGLNQAASGDLLTARTNASNLLQGAQNTGAADYLNQFNQGSQTSLSGDQMAVQGQLAYNQALNAGLTTLGNLAGQAIGAAFGGAPGAAAASSAGAPQSLTTSLNTGNSVIPSFLSNLFSGPSSAPAPSAYASAATAQGNPLLGMGSY